MDKIINKKMYWVICVAIILFNYYMFFFTDIGIFHHGVTVSSFVFMSGTLVLGTLALFDIYRLTTNKFYKLSMCIIIILFNYYIFFFTDIGNFYHGGTVLSSVFSGVALVLGALASFEIYRLTTNKFYKSVGILSLVLFAITLISILYFGLVSRP